MPVFAELLTAFPGDRIGGEDAGLDRLPDIFDDLCREDQVRPAPHCVEHLACGVLGFGKDVVPELEVRVQVRIFLVQGQDVKVCLQVIVLFAL